MVLLLKKLWNKFFPIKKYYPLKHYVISDNDQGFLIIDIIKGPWKGSTVAFETVLEDPYGAIGLTLKTKLLKGDYDFTSDPNWCIIAADIFEYEWGESLKNYQKLREDILEDDTDRIDYFEEFVPQRTVYKKGNSAPKKRILSRQKRKNSVPRDSRIHSKVQPPSDHGSDSDIFGE
jgi:hypothetical protein